MSPCGDPTAALDGIFGVVLDDPWFGYSDAPAGLRAILIRDASAEFKDRNLITTSEIEWRLRRGRPRKSMEEHRERIRLRQRRWRKAQALANDEVSAPDLTRLLSQNNAVNARG